jgi:tetratricopeptide (TPR) repeat protein
MGIFITPSYGLNDKELWTLYERGEKSFRKANELVAADPQKAKDLYRKAVLTFETVVRDGGVQNGRLYYNIGNTYFRLGELGRALLYYRKAETLIPNDPNLQQNIRYAKSRTVDKIEEKPQAKVIKTLFFWHYDLDRRTRSVLFVLFFTLIWVSSTAFLFKKRAVFRYGAITGALVSLLLFTSLAVEAFHDSRSRLGVIVSNEVTARKGDSRTYQPSFKEPLHAGAEFSLLEHRKGWYHIELFDGRRCWIPDSAGELVHP